MYSGKGKFSQYWTFLYPISSLFNFTPSLNPSYILPPVVFVLGPCRSSRYNTTGSAWI